MKKIAIIPARGGSKRIPKKNIKAFFGKPIIAYSIEKSLQSGLFDEVMVSTDDLEIAKVAKEYGAKTPFLRSDANANDFATLADVVDEVIDWYEANDSRFDIGCCFLPTAPLVSIDYLKYGLEILSKQNADSVRPIVKFSYPIQRALKMCEGGKVEMFYPEYKTARSQDLEAAFHDAGQFYWFKMESRMYGQNKIGFEIAPKYVQDIDTPDDWSLAELKYKNLNA